MAKVESNNPCGHHVNSPLEILVVHKVNQPGPMAESISMFILITFVKLLLNQRL
jgi:hypothetical protein